MSLNPSEDQQYPPGMCRWGAACRLFRRESWAGPSHKSSPLSHSKPKLMLVHERLFGCQGALGWVGVRGNSQMQQEPGSLLLFTVCTERPK